MEWLIAPNLRLHAPEHIQLFMLHVISRGGLTALGYITSRAVHSLAFYM